MAWTSIQHIAHEPVIRAPIGLIARPAPSPKRRFRDLLHRRFRSIAELFRQDPAGAELERRVRRLAAVMDDQAPGSINRMRSSSLLNAATSRRDAHYARRRGDREMAALHETEAEHFERASRCLTGWERHS